MADTIRATSLADAQSRWDNGTATAADEALLNSARSSGSTGYSGGSRSTGSRTTTGTADVYASWYAQQKAAAEALAAQQRAAAEDAYNRNMASLNDAYTNRGGLLSDNYNSTLSDMQNTYDQNSGVVNQNVDRSLRDAYVNMMMNKRDMPQMLAAQGISGGMSESTLADIRNQYGGARGDLELSRNNSLDELLLALQNNQGEASRLYNDQQATDNLNRMNQEMSLRNMLENRIYSILTDQFSNLSSLEGAYLQAMSQAAQNNASAGGRVAGASSSLSAGNIPASLSTNQQTADALSRALSGGGLGTTLDAYERWINGTASPADSALISNYRQ